MKPTIATVKSFIKKNKDQLYIKVSSNFDGMVDCVIPAKSEFTKVDQINMEEKYTLGIKGAWFVGNSRDYITPIENGYEIYNSCGSFILKKI